jgi:hypothetical protein
MNERFSPTTIACSNKVSDMMRTLAIPAKVAPSHSVEATKELST